MQTTQHPAGHPLAYLRHRHGLSLEDLAGLVRRELVRQGLRSGITRQRIADFEHPERRGGRYPGEELQRVLARVFDIPQELVRPEDWPWWLPATDSPMHQVIPQQRAWSASPEGRCYPAGGVRTPKRARQCQTFLRS
ncbi:helix-turn-helix transcriptional regulator [Streptomyces sp. RFCAC02]|uniref:helix-turn-helix transcriptional regulator n=1 Tax=Streptomyces sp. RFCAC02 TaxID=2499143 RepID=UPI0010220179|nr:helix-turn-helix transcriptional regulator [Streptomyces sp. RFCAC02]